MALNPKVKIIIGILIIAIIVVGGAAISPSCKLNENETTQIQNYEKYLDELNAYNKLTSEEIKVQNLSKPREVNFEGGWWDRSVLNIYYFIGCERDYNGGFSYAGTKNWMQQKLGFNEGFFSFFYPHMFVGLLAGLWIWIIFLSAHFATKILPTKKYSSWMYAGRPDEVGRLQRSWLYLIGSSPWKIAPIALLYAVLMELPFIHTALDFILLAFLRDNILLRSIMLAFYIGLLPSAIEEYYKFKVRKYWDMKIEEARQQKRYVREVANA